MEKESAQKQQEAEYNAFEDMQADEDLGTRYPIDDETMARLNHEFTYHSPHGDQGVRYVQIRMAARDFLETILALTPPSREQSNAHSRIREAVMWANAAIAIGENEPGISFTDG